MAKTLGGSTFAWNAVSQDYNIIETLNCLLDGCDQVSIVFGGTDGTVQLVQDWLSTVHQKTIFWRVIDEQEWNSQQGREKLSYFSNIAMEVLTTDFVLYCQADEVVHEKSWPVIRKAIELEGHEGFMIHRLNLWSTPYMMLNVEHSRKPVSTEIIRLVKKGYWCVDDAESCACPVSMILPVYMFHMGFVRDKNKHLQKIRHMQKDVFLMDYDKRADLFNEFKCWHWGFSPSDLIPIPMPLPKYIERWAKERTYPAFQEDEHHLAKEFLQHINYDMSTIKIMRFPERSLVEIANGVFESVPRSLAGKHVNGVK